MPELARDMRRAWADALGTSQLPRQWRGAVRLERVLQEVRDRFDGLVPAPLEHDVLERAVRALAADAELTTRQLEACCSGLSVPVSLDGHDAAICDLPLLTERLLARVRRLRSAGATTRTATALARGLLCAPHDPHPVSARNLATLTDALYALVERDAPQINEAAVAQLRRLQPLLVERDVTALVPAVLEGESDRLADLHRLHVPPTSWVWAALADGAAAMAEQRTEAEYRRAIPALLAWLREHPALLDGSLGRIIRHLAGADDRAELPVVRDLAVERWGTPHLEDNHAKWRAMATEAGRQLVASWVAREVIELFFSTLHAHGDPQRRATFWRMQAERIDDLWVYAGDALARDPSADAELLRRLLGSRLHRLTDEDETSTFVMRIGSCFFVEFSTSGNALYIYPRRDLPVLLGVDYPRAQTFKAPERGIRVRHAGNWQARVHELIDDAIE